MGLAYVAPIGAQNLFVIQSAIGQKRSRAFLTALIVVFFDVTLALACFFGIGALIFLLIAIMVWMVWIIWLDRYVVYTRDGAQLRFDIDVGQFSGIAAERIREELRRVTG